MINYQTEISNTNYNIGGNSMNCNIGDYSEMTIASPSMAYMKKLPPESNANLNYKPN